MRSHHVGNRLSFRDIALRFYACLTPDSSLEAWHIFFINRNSSDLMQNPNKKIGNPSHEVRLPQDLKRGELKRKGACLRKIRMFCKGQKNKAFLNRGHSRVSFAHCLL